MIIGKNPRAKAPNNFREYFRRYRSWNHLYSNATWLPKFKDDIEILINEHKEKMLIKSSIIKYRHL